MFDDSVKTGERQTKEIPITAYTGYPNNKEAVAEFSIGLSIKDKGEA